MRIELPRIFRQPGQERGFGIAQIGDRFVEVIIGSRGQSDVQVAEVEAVEISGEDLFFRPGLFETERDDALDDFRPQRARATLGNFHELLGDGRGARYNPAMAQPSQERAARGEPIDSVVGVEAFVLRGKNSVDDIPRHVFERELVAESLGNARLAEWNAVAIEERDALHRRAEQRCRDRNEA